MVIRAAEKKDAGEIASCLLPAMEEIVYTFIKKRDLREAFHFLKYFAGQESHQYSYQNCFVATTGAEIAGTINIYNGNRLNELREPVLRYIHEKYNPGLEPENESFGNEYYLDTIGVLPLIQGRGIGTKLIEYAIQEFVVRQNQKLGLLVDAENPKAKMLYTRMGFTVMNQRMVFGRKMDHMQITNRSLPT